MALRCHGLARSGAGLITSPMKTKTKSPHGTASKPSVLTLTLPLSGAHAHLLAACAAYDGQTVEEYTLAALRSSLASTAEAIGYEMNRAS